MYRIMRRMAVGGWLLLSLASSGWTEAGTTPDNAAKLRTIEALYEDYRRSFSDVTELTATQIMQLVGRMPLVFVDVREEEEQRVSMIPGAIDEKAFLAAPELQRGRLVVGYCTISYRSGELAKKLRSRGIPMVNLRGGILAWLHAGGTVVAGSQTVRRVHVYGEKWNLAPDGYEAVW